MYMYNVHEQITLHKLQYIYFKVKIIYNTLYSNNGMLVLAMSPKT